MSDAMTAPTAAEARRERQGARIEATRLKRKCPLCDGQRVYPQAGIGNQNKAICYDCGGRFKRRSKK